MATASATPTLLAAEICRNLSEKGPSGLFLISVEPIHDLAWDQTPRQFRAALCNSLAVATLPDGRFVVWVYASGEKNPLGQTAEISAQLMPGLREFTFASWTPGLQNHLTACVQRPVVEIVVGYKESASSDNFRPVPLPNGTDRVTFPIKCGGNYP